ncbi:MAG: hypothetical protein NVSMB45_19070 [Ginsengibacter sp.]
MKVINKNLIISLVLGLSCVPGWAQDNITSGKSTFTSHCSSCHLLGSVLVGPDLTNVDKRHSADWILKFVKSSQTVVKSGDKEAVALFDQFKMVMPDQLDLSENDIRSVISYISSTSVSAIIEKPPLATPFVLKPNNLPIVRSNYFIISFYLILVTLLISAVYFAVSVQILKRAGK